MIHRHKRTNIFIIDKELWAWAQYRAKTLGYESSSDYLFDLIKLDKEKNIVNRKDKKTSEGK
jgi:prophage antirepressor-like protein